MNLSDLVHEVWKDERMKRLGIRKSETEIILKVIIDKIFEALVKDRILKIHNLFTLDVRKHKGRKIQNPQTREDMHIGDFHTVGLKESAKLKKELKKMD